MDAAAAVARIAELEAQVRQRDALITTMQEQLRAMEARMAAMQRRLFGRSSERLNDPNQQSIDFGQGASGPFAVAAAPLRTRRQPRPTTRRRTRRRTTKSRSVQRSRAVAASVACC